MSTTPTSWWTKANQDRLFDVLLVLVTIAVLGGLVHVFIFRVELPQTFEAILWFLGAGLAIEGGRRGLGRATFKAEAVAAETGNDVTVTETKTKETVVDHTPVGPLTPLTGVPPEGAG